MEFRAISRIIPRSRLVRLKSRQLSSFAAYAPFANGGYRVKPRLVRRIETRDGKVIWSSEIAAPIPVMDPRDAYQMTSMLRGVVDYGTGRPIRDYGVKGLVAGKTGTTNDGADVWFVGYTPNLVAAFWFGYDERHTVANDASGGRLAAPAWAEFYKSGWTRAGTGELVGATAGNGWRDDRSDYGMARQRVVPRAESRVLQAGYRAAHRVHRARAAGIRHGVGRIRRAGHRMSGRRARISGRRSEKLWVRSSGSEASSEKSNYQAHSVQKPLRRAWSCRR